VVEENEMELRWKERHVLKSTDTLDDTMLKRKTTLFKILMFTNDCYPNHLWWVRLDEVGRVQAWLEFDLLKLHLPVFPHLLQYQTCHKIQKNKWNVARN